MVGFSLRSLSNIKIFTVGQSELTVTGVVKTLSLDTAFKNNPKSSKIVWGAPLNLLGSLQFFTSIYSNALI